jgi:hypothetical protein
VSTKAIQGTYHLELSFRYASTLLRSFHQLKFWKRILRPAATGGYERDIEHVEWTGQKLSDSVKPGVVGIKFDCCELVAISRKNDNKDLPYVKRFKRDRK